MEISINKIVEELDNKKQPIALLCRRCIGCNQLEDEEFNGNNRCKNYVADIKRTKNRRKW